MTANEVQGNYIRTKHVPAERGITAKKQVNSKPEDGHHVRRHHQMQEMAQDIIPHCTCSVLCCEPSYFL